MSGVATPKRSPPSGYVGDIHTVTCSRAWAGSGRHGEGMSPVLLVTRHDDVRAAVLRLAALAGTPVQVEATGAGARSAWRAASVVVVGPDCTGNEGLTRREGVLLVTIHPPDAATWQRAVEVGAEAVLTLPEAEHRVLEAFVAAGEPSQPRGVVVGVVGGCGGAGASTLGAALGLTAARAGSAALVDADPIGGGIDVLLGAEHTPGARWPDLAGTRGRLSAAALLDAVPRVHGLAVVSWDRGDPIPLPTAAAASVLDAAVRGATTVVVDLPRQVDASTEVLVAGCDVLLVVVPATVRATAASARLVARLAHLAPVPGLIVREAGAPRLAPADITAALGLDLRAVLPNEPSVVAAALHGRPPVSRPRGALHDCCRSLLGTFGAGVAA
jgi:secretion/DNA translocation related CpaE-like protein